MMRRIDTLTAVVLAGGRGVRMGGPKATLEMGGRRLIDRAVALCSAVFERVVVIRGDPRRGSLPGLTVPQIPDAWPGHGALGGIHAGLKACPAAGAVVLACDMPLMQEAFLRLLADRHGDEDVLVPRSPSGLQPLCAVYALACLPAIEACLTRGQRQVIAVYPQVHARELVMGDEPGWRGREDIFTNVNTPRDMDRVEARLKVRT